MSILEQISENLQKGKAADVKSLVAQALNEGIKPSDVLMNGMIAGMNIIGEKFKKNEVYVPHVLIAARAMHAGMDILKPELIKSGVEPIGKIVVGTVKGDLHDIGKNLVCMMLEGAGFEVFDAGIDCTAEKLVDLAVEKNAPVIGLSALLTTTMPSMKDVIAEIQKRNLQSKIKVMIGGAPVTQNYADEIGADGYSTDAASAVDLAKKILDLAN